MADFCKQCAGAGCPSDFSISAEKLAEGVQYLEVMCEGCGDDIVVDHEGVCQGVRCVAGHELTAAARQAGFEPQEPPAPRDPPVVSPSSSFQKLLDRERD